MKYKFKFQQHVNGIETCEAIIDADNKTEAFNKYSNREFTTYLIIKQDVERALVEDFNPEVTTIDG